MSTSNEDTIKYRVTPGYSITKSSLNKAQPSSSKRGVSFVASKNRSSVTKSFGRKSNVGWDEYGDTTKGIEQRVRMSSSRPARLSALVNQTIYVGGQEDLDQVKHFLCIPLTNNVKALFVMMVMFAAISLGQYFAAIAAASQSLKADVVSMAVDALSYFGNILGESSDVPAQRAVLQLFFSLISVGLLLYFNTSIFLESIEIFKANDGSNEEEESEGGVEGSIVFAFATLGLLFDAICLYAYHYYAKKDAEIEYQILKEEAAANSKEEGEGDDASGAKIKKPKVNMLTALLHVSADLLRSTTTFVEGIILMTVGLSPSAQAYVDSICGIIIGASLYVACIYAIYEWITEFTGWFRNLGAPIEVYVPEIGANIVVTPDRAGHSKAADAFLG